MDDKSAEFREQLLAVQISAAVGGHELGQFLADSAGWEAICFRCLGRVTVRPDGEIRGELSAECHATPLDAHAAVF